jgi:hypothetical protein
MQFRIFEISIKFSIILNTQYDLLQGNIFSPLRRVISQLFGHKAPTKKENAQNIEKRT